MSTVVVSPEEYLKTSYHPDCEYVDGVIVERNLGERPHSLVLRNLLFAVVSRWGHLHAWPEQRIRTISRKRYRVPDLCVTLSDPRIGVFEEPPFLCIEILSEEDRWGELVQKLDEYVALGVPHNWIVDPWTRRAFHYRNRSFEEVEILTAGEIQLTLEEVFRGL